MTEQRLRLKDLGDTPESRAEAAAILQDAWDRSWQVGAKKRWSDRPAPRELGEAIKSGWLPKTGRVVDLGCGTAEIAAWFAARGYQVTATDIAQAALDQAAKRHGDLPAIDYIAANLCTETLPGRQFDILVDRGCLHQLPEYLIPDYIQNIAAMAAPGAKMLLFTKAFRDGRPFADPKEMDVRTKWIRTRFQHTFNLERAEPTYLAPGNPDDPLPGMTFWMTRLQA